MGNIYNIIYIDYTKSFYLKKYKNDKSIYNLLIIIIYKSIFNLLIILIYKSIFNLLIITQ